MSITPDVPGLPGNDLNSDDDKVFDDLARRAGAALRRPAPEDGVSVIAAQGRRQQAIKATVVGGVGFATLIGALLVVSNRDDPDRLPPVDSSVLATLAGDGPALLAPPADLDELVVTEAAHGQSVPGIVRGAVQTPSGEIIGITINAYAMGDGLGGGFDIGGHEDVFVERHAGNDFFAYFVGGSCWEARITMSDGLETPTPWSYTFPEVETFFRQLTITGTDPEPPVGPDDHGGTLTIQVPPGWESLGAATVSDRYTLHFSATVDLRRLGAVSPEPELDAEFQLDQRPDTGIGVFLADPGRTDPRPTATLSGRQAWLMPGSGGWITLVFDDDGTAVSLRARGLDEGTLVAFADTLVTQPWGETAALPASTNPTQTSIDERLPENVQPMPQDCNVSLQIVE